MGLYLALAVIVAAVASSHQLSPFMLTGALVVLWTVDRRDIRLLPLLAGAITIAWVSWGAQAYWVSHLSRLTEDVGAVGNVVTAGTADRIADGSAARRVVLTTRLLLSGAAWLAAAGSFFLAARRSRSAITVAALGVVPFGAVAMQEYGGELGLRIFLFSLPFVSLLVAYAVDAALHASRSVARLALVGSIAGAAVVIPAFVVARYGNEQFEQIYPEDVAAVQAFYDDAPLEAYVIGNNTSNPFRMGPFHDYQPLEFEGLADPANVDLEAALRDAGIGDGYVLVMEAGIKEALLRDGAASGWENRLHDELIGMGATERFRERRAAVYEFTLPDVAPAPEPAKPARTLASRFIRQLLAWPALEFACAVLLFVVVFGAFHVAGHRQRIGWPDVASWVGVLAVTAVVLVRFAAYT